MQDKALAKLSVIVPVGPQDSMSMHLRGQLTGLPASAEILVVYPQPDRIEAQARNPGAGPEWRIVTSQAGRAVQQNAGARAARNNWLWFLHADSQLTEETLPALTKFIAADADRLGYFDLAFLDDGPSLMFVNAFGAWREVTCSTCRLVIRVW